MPSNRNWWNIIMSPYNKGVLDFYVFILLILGWGVSIFFAILYQDVFAITILGIVCLVLAIFLATSQLWRTFMSDVLLGNVDPNEKYVLYKGRMFSLSRDYHWILDIYQITEEFTQTFLLEEQEYCVSLSTNHMLPQGEGYHGLCTIVATYRVYQGAILHHQSKIFLGDDVQNRKKSIKEIEESLARISKDYGIMSIELIENKEP